MKVRLGWEEGQRERERECVCAWRVQRACRSMGEWELSFSSLLSLSLMLAPLFLLLTHTGGR